jgi:hypothetical protein
MTKRRSFDTPSPAAGMSSSRKISYTLTRVEIKKAYMLPNKAYYHTFLWFSLGKIAYKNIILTFFQVNLNS